MNEDDHQDDRSRIERIKQHLKDNKKAYFISAGVGVGCFTTGYLLRPQVVNIVDAFNLKYKSPTTTEITNIVLARRACPNPIPVRDKLTGECYASIRRAMQATGKNFFDISKDAKGAQIRFERLPDSVLA